MTLLLPLAGCATPSIVDHPAALTPFAEASRFVPEGMTSFAFLHTMPEVTPTLEDPNICVWAGRDFTGPRVPGLGDARSITISRYARGGIERQLQESGWFDEVPAVHVDVAGHRCWLLLDDDDCDSGAWWITIVDDQWLLVASHHEVVASALQRAGSVETHLGSFGDLSFLPDDATDLIFTLPRSDEPRVWGKPVPTERMVFTWSREPWRLSMYSRQSPHVDYGRLLGNVWPTDGPTREQVNGWLRHSGPVIAEAAPFESAMGGPCSGR